MALLQRTPEIKGRREFERALDGWNIDQSAGVTVVLEPGPAASFRLVGIDRKGLVIASTRVRDMIDAATQRSSAPTIDDVESERRMHFDRRMQGRRQVPRLVAHSSNEFARPAGRAKRNATSAAGDYMAV